MNVTRHAAQHMILKKTSILFYYFTPTSLNAPVRNMIHKHILHRSSARRKCEEEHNKEIISGPVSRELRRRNGARRAPDVRQTSFSVRISLPFPSNVRKDEEEIRIVFALFISPKLSPPFRY